MQLATGDRRPAYLTEIHAALTSLTEHDQARLGVIAGWKTAPHQLTCRQVEHTFRLITRALSKTEPDGAPSAGLQRLCDQLTEASIPEELKDASGSLAVDRTDLDGWSAPARGSEPGRRPRPGGPRGPPKRHPKNQERKNVLRLLPVSSGHDKRRHRPGRPRARPPDPRRQQQPRPRRRPGRRARLDARR